MVDNKEYLTRLMATMEDLEESVATFKAMIYGVSGVGKTVLSFQIAQEITPLNKIILYVDTAEGWVSLKNHPELKTRSRRMAYKNLDQLKALCQAIRMKEDFYDTIGTIIIDEASSAADTTLDEVLIIRAPQKRGEDPDTPTQPDFNMTTNLVRKSYFNLLTLPGVHVILVSHTREDKDARNIVKQSASFMPKLGAKLKQPMHLVAHLSGNDIPATEDKPARYERIMQVHPTRTIDAKTRIGGLQPQVTYEEFMPKLKSWLGEGAKSDGSRTSYIVPDNDPEVPTPVEVEVEGE